MKRDGRQLDHKTLEVIRRMSVERVREGEVPSAVIASYGFCPHDDLQMAEDGEGSKGAVWLLFARAKGQAVLPS